MAGRSPSHPQEGPAGDSPLQEADPDAFCSSHLSDSAADKEQSGGVVRESSVATCLHVSRAESGRPEEAVGRVAEEAWVPEFSVGSEDQALGPGGASTSSSHPPQGLTLGGPTFFDPHFPRGPVVVIMALRRG